MSEDINFAYVLACADPKIRGPLTRHFDNRFGKERYFWVPELGGVKDLVSPVSDAFREHILAKMADAAKVHPFGLIILINHSNCGAYRLGEIMFDDSKKEEAFHTEELKKAGGAVRARFPSVAVELHYCLKEEGGRLAW